MPHVDEPEADAVAKTPGRKTPPTWHLTGTAVHILYINGAPHLGVHQERVRVPSRTFHLPVPAAYVREAYRVHLDDELDVEVERATNVVVRILVLRRHSDMPIPVGIRPPPRPIMEVLAELRRNGDVASGAGTAEPERQP